MLRSTPKLRSLYQKNNTFHIEALYRSLICFAKSTWSMTSEAAFAWKPCDCLSIWFKRSEPQRRFLYIILHYNALALFSFYRNLYIKVKWTLPLNNSLRTEAELTQTDHRFSSWVYVWFIWIILAFQYTDTNEWLWQWPLFLYNKLKQGISCRTRCETSSCNGTALALAQQHFGRCYSFLWPQDFWRCYSFLCMNRFEKLRVMNLFPIQNASLRHHWQTIKNKEIVQDQSMITQKPGRQDNRRLNIQSPAKTECVCATFKVLLMWDSCELMMRSDERHVIATGDESWVKWQVALHGPKI